MEIAENTGYAIRIESMIDGSVVMRQGAFQNNVIIIPAAYVRDVALYIASCVKQFTP